KNPNKKYKKGSVFLRNLHIFILSALFLGNLLPSAQAADPANPIPPPPNYYINGQAAFADSGEPLNDVKQVTACEALPGYQRYTDYAQGYSVCVPASLAPNFSLSAVRSSFVSGPTQLEVYYDNFSDSISNPRDYTVYANRFLPNSSRHSISVHETFGWNGFTVNRIKWSRAPLASLANDRNHYTSLELLRYPDEAYTIFIKSAEAIENDLAILHSFQLAEKRGAPGIFRQPAPAKTKLNKETRDFKAKYFSENSPLRWGYFDCSAPEQLRPVKELEARLGYKFTFVLRYQSLDERAAVEGLANGYTDGRFTELTMQTTHADTVNALLAGANRGNQDLMYDILDRQYDEYFREYAKSLKAFGHPVLFRLNNEMNGDWCWYSAMYAGKDTDIYKAVWRHIHNLFDEVGVDNVLWVWNPHDTSLPDFKWNHPLMYYPGDDVVDIIGITGYNTGTYFPGEKWRTFHDIYKQVDVNYSDWFDKPFMITEFGSNSVGGDKAAWIDSMFREIPEYKRIKVAIWWSGVDLDEAGRPGRVYLLDENDTTTEAFRRGLKNYNNQK
ncbi:MAG TPA: glycosyl hydrolase, partial [Negativicutes bacterium]|nr:glycosyl hydrolase [Negativicutes bacterium]